MSNKPRVIISTDAQLATGINNINGDKDDIQSLAHALLYQDKVDIQAIVSSTSRWQPGKNDVKFVHHVLDAYGEDYANLSSHASGFKTEAALHSIVYQGTKSLAGSSGIVGQTAGSNAIVKEAREAKAVGDDLYVLAWGGTGDVARALYDAPDIKDTVRLISIYDQEPNANKWLDNNFVGTGKGGWWLDVMSSFKGTYASPTSNNPMSQAWAAENAKGHGKLGDLFYQNTFDIRGTSGTHNGMKMGDSNSFFYLIDSADNNNPAANGWGGKYRQVKEGYWTDSTDGAFSISGSNGSKYVYEDRAAWMGDFAKRLDWLKGSTTAPLPPIEPTNPAPSNPVITDNALVIRVSGEDAGLAKNPMITVLVDGVSKGTFAVTADHSDGAWQTIAIDSAWSKTSDHKVEVKYYDAKKAQSVFLDSVSLNGDVNGTDVSMLGRTFKNYYLGDIL